MPQVFRSFSEKQDYTIIKRSPPPPSYSKWLFCFLIVGGLYSVTALRENDQERVTVHTKHRLKLHSPTTLTILSSMT